MIDDIADSNKYFKKYYEFIEWVKDKKVSDITSPEQVKRGQEILDRIIGDKFSDITSPEGLVKYLTSKKKNKDAPEEYVSHYTSYDVAKKIVSGKKMLLGNPADMNDGLEFSDPAIDCTKIYFASFSFEKTENIGMWSMYGQPWKDGVRISIPKRLFLSWADQIDKLYHFDSITKTIIGSNPIDRKDFVPSITRVAYVAWDDKGEVEQIRCGDNAKNNLLKNVKEPILSGLVKDSAWSYEKEIRLRVDVLSQISDKKIAVNIPEDVLSNMIITTGPRFDNVIPSNEFSGVARVKKSVFAGKLNYIYCDVCNATQNGKSI